MALIFNADRVKEDASTTGTGTFSLSGAATGGYQTFVAGIGTGNRCIYCAYNTANNEWEVGLGTVTDASPDTLSRDEVWRSSNSNAKVSFTAAPTVFVTAPALIDPAPAHNYLINGTGRFCARGSQLGARPTANVSMVSAALTSVSSLTGLRLGMSCYNATYVNTGQTISTIDSATQVTMSANGNGASPGAVTIEIGLKDGDYCADRWYVLAQTKNLRYDRSTNSPDANDDCSISILQNHATAQRMGVAQVIEFKDSRPLRGKYCRAQAQVMITASGQTVRVAILAWTSTADSPTKDVVNNWTSSTFTAGNFFLGSNLTVVATGSVSPSASTWTDLACIGQIPTNANNVYVFFWTDGTQAQDVQLLVAQAGLYPTPVPQNWNPRPIAIEELLCKRYYETTFGRDVAPTFSSSTYGHTCGQAAAASTAWNIGAPWRFSVPKRVSPTMTYMNGFAYNQQIRNVNTGTDFTGTTNNGIGVDAIHPYGTSPGGSAKGDLVNVHMIADAELGA